MAMLSPILRLALAVAFAILTVALAYADRIYFPLLYFYGAASLIAFISAQSAIRWRVELMWLVAIVASLLWLDLLGLDLQFLMGWTIADRIDPDGVMRGYIPNLWLVAAKIVLAIRCTALARRLSRMASPPPPTFSIPLWNSDRDKHT